MMNPVQTTIPQADGSDRYVIIEPIIEKEGKYGWRSTSVFKIYADAFGDETHLFIGPAGFDEVNDNFPDEENPDYLGKLHFDNGSVKHFEGELLSLVEQAYLAVFIETYQEPDI